MNRGQHVLEGHAAGLGRATYIHRTARFDSTHFQDQADVQVKVVATDEKNRTYSARWTGKAYNKALSLWNSVVDYHGGPGMARVPSEAAAAACRARKHSTTGPSSAYHEPSIIASLPAYTVFFMVTHGNQDEFGDCMAEAVPADEEPEHYITAGEVRAGRPLEGLYGLREKLSDLSNPSSPRVIPKYNLVVLYACNCAEFDLLANAFDVNREAAAFVGWRTTGKVCKENREWFRRLWEGLSRGKAISVAIQDASDVAPALILDEWNHDHVGEPRIIGYGRTKLTGLYD